MGAINEILKTFDKYWTGEKTNQQINDVEQNLTTVLTKLINDNNLKINENFKLFNERLTIDEDKIAHLPSNQQWKEVGTKVNINHIRYNFITNKKYKIYYNFENQTSIKKFAFICKEFLYGELNTDVQTLDWDKVNDRIMVSLQMQNDTIAIVSDPTRYGQLLKLEELQE